MIKLLARRALRTFSNRYRYDTGYLETILDHDPAGFLKFSLVNIPAAHRRGIEPAPWWAARIRAALHEDCGPCVQLVCDQALEAGVAAAEVADIASGRLAALSPDTALAIRYTAAVLSREEAATALHDAVLARWGQQGLFSLALAISMARLYPSLKYALGHGRHCARLRIAGESVAPSNGLSITLSSGLPAEYCQ